MTLREARTLCGRTQAQLADASGVAQAVISRIETHGSPDITLRTARALAGTLQIDLSQLDFSISSPPSAETGA